MCVEALFLLTWNVCLFNVFYTLYLISKGGVNNLVVVAWSCWPHQNVEAMRVRARHSSHFLCQICMIYAIPISTATATVRCWIVWCTFAATTASSRNSSDRLKDAVTFSSAPIKTHAQRMHAHARQVRECMYICALTHRYKRHYCQAEEKELKRLKDAGHWVQTCWNKTALRYPFCTELMRRLLQGPCQRILHLCMHTCEHTCIYLRMESQCKGATHNAEHHCFHNAIMHTIMHAEMYSGDWATSSLGSRIWAGSVLCRDI